MIVSSADSAADIGAELFTWQFATAVAGALMGLHPFDQPDVEAAKLATRRLLEDQRADPGSSLSAADGRQEHFRVAAHHSGPHPTGPHQTEQDERAATPQTLLRQLLAVDSSGLYFAILAYLPETESTLVALQRLRRLVRQRRGWATTLGFGPRYLHSTGQLHKGGANRGRFLVITAEPPVDSLEGADGGVGLGRLQLAQGLGDVLVLAERGRHVVHVHLRCAQTPDLESSLKELVELIGSTLDGTRAA
jgi:hypothetical protein